MKRGVNIPQQLFLHGLWPGKEAEYGQRKQQGFWESYKASEAKIKFGDLRSQEPNEEEESQRSECDTQLIFPLILKLGKTRI